MKYTYFTLFLLACITSADSFAQTTIGKQKTVGGHNDDFLSSIQQTIDGGYILGGSSPSNISGLKTDTCRGHNDYWVVKLDSLNHVQWDKTIGGSQNDYLQSLQQTSDGGYILGGYSISDESGEKTENSRGRYDYWIVKLDSIGNVQWDKTIGGNDDDVLTSVHQTKNGSYILGGSSYSFISGEKTDSSRGLYDYWVVKIDSLGNIISDKAIGGSGMDNLTCLQQTLDGGYILGGSSTSNISGEKTENCRGSGSDYWVVKLDGTGNIEWDKTIGGNLGDGLESLQQTSDSGYILGGTSSSAVSGEKRDSSRGRNDYWVVKLNSLGHIKWDKTIGGSSIDDFRSLQQTVDDGYILGGNSSSNMSGEKTENCKGGSDYWIVKLNRQGIFQWDKTIGGSAFDQLSSIKEIAKNHYVLGGTSNSGISGDKTQPSRKYDYWIVFLDYKKPAAAQITSAKNESSFSIANNARNNFILYPNPAKDILYVETNIKAVFSLADEAGKILLTKIIDGSGDINVSKLASGVYYLKNNATGKTEKIALVK